MQSFFAAPTWEKCPFNWKERSTNFQKMETLLLPISLPIVRPFLPNPRRSLTSGRHARRFLRSQGIRASQATTSAGDSRDSEAPYVKEEISASGTLECERNSSFLGATSALALSTMAAPLPSLAANSGLFSIADMDAKTAGSVAAVLGPFLAFSILLMICRIPLSWYPNLDVKKLPWSIAVAPTEPLLGATRRAIPPVGGVDVAPIVWVALLTFVNEILLGPQGILNLLQRKAEL